VAGTLQFGDFELDVKRYELRRLGRPVRIERIPMELLILLLEHRGDLVSREEIVERLWGKKTFVDAETGVNTAIRKVRQALKDSTDRPVFIQTISAGLSIPRARYVKVSNRIVHLSRKARFSL
jgi:DNA-binding winged helix-turn-helix (wHTH) protein